MEYTPSVPYTSIPGTLPPDLVAIDADLSSLQSTVEEALRNLSEDSLAPNAIWRDWVSITGTVKTYNGISDILSAWRLGLSSRKILSVQTQPAFRMNVVQGSSWAAVQVTFRVELSNGLAGNAVGLVNLIPHGASHWKIWTLSTALDSWEGLGHPEVPHPNPRHTSSLEKQTSVAIIGAGQSGLSMAGRLDAMGISNVLIEKENRVGSAWWSRYDSVMQHTVREYNNLPFERTWKPDDPKFLPAAKVVEGFENYVQKYDINIWLGSRVVSCKRDDPSSKWLISIERSTGETHNLEAEHLVLAIGAGLSKPRRPNWPGGDTFAGDLVHAWNIKNTKKWAGKRGVIVGSGTSAHDIAQDMVRHGLASVTMLQRNPTAIFPIEMLEVQQNERYNLEIPTATADITSMILPEKIIWELVKAGEKVSLKAFEDRFAAVEKAGFRIDREKCMVEDIYSRYGGYYIDVGASQLIADGHIKVISGVPVSRFTEKGIMFTNGDELEADAIVLATGAEQDYRKVIAPMFGQDIANKVGDFWGLDKDGDIRGTMTPAYPGLWLMGGAATHARFHSRFIGLQLQAEMFEKGTLQMKSTNGVGK